MDLKRFLHCSAATISVSNIFVFTDSLDDRAVSNNYTYSDDSDENILAVRHFIWRNKVQSASLELKVSDGPFKVRFISTGRALLQC